MPSSLAPRIAALALAVLTATNTVQAQTPLVERRYSWNNLPYKADPDTGVRGTQYGYNRCNATTEGPTSLCQTALINSLDDFCLWAPPEPNSIVGNTEGEMVAWCTKAGHGTRIIPEGALTGVQFIRTPSYVQVTGRIRQDLVNIVADDYGGEMDSAGADQRGNPLGGLVYSTAYGNAQNADHAQIIRWHNFMGGGVFCFKACDPSRDNAARMCEHVYDRIGCAYNAPAAYTENVFETCQGNDQLPPGLYVGANGATSTYYQPPESEGPITLVPYTAAIPASSNCVASPSSAIFTAAASIVSVSSASVASVSSVSAASVSSASAASESRASPSRPAPSGFSGGNAAPSVSAVNVNSGAEVGVKLSVLNAFAAVFLASCGLFLARLA